MYISLLYIVSYPRKIRDQILTLEGLNFYMFQCGKHWTRAHFAFEQGEGVFYTRNAIFIDKVFYLSGGFFANII